MNQSIADKEIQNFFIEIGVRDVYSEFNQIEISELDNTYREGTKYIDLIAISQGILNYIEGYRLFEVNKITITDHRVYVFDINLK